MISNSKVILTIIVPVYNTESYLRECLDSLQNQTLNNYEILIVNDGSTDNSGMIAKDFVSRFTNVYYIEQENKGLGAARNAGLKYARGKYIYFMDSDDYLLKESLTNLVEYAEKFSLDAIFFDANTFYDSDEEVFSVSYDRGRDYGVYDFGEQLMCELMVNKQFWSSACLYMIKKDVLDQNNLSFIENYLHEDELFTVQLFLAIKKCMHINELYFQRRVRKSSIMTSSRTKERVKGYLKVLQSFDEIYLNYNFLNKKSEKEYIKNMGKIYCQILVLINEEKQIEKENLKYLFSLVKVIGRKFKYFNAKGFLMTFNFPIYEKISQLKNYLIF